MTSYVIDTSAVLAFLWQEPGSDRVLEVLSGEDHLTSTVNLAELAGRACDAGMSVEDVTSLLSGLELQVQPFDERCALECGLLRPATRSLGLSLGDRACLALAKLRGATALTADRAWTELDPALGISVECVRPDTADLR